MGNVEYKTKRMAGRWKRTVTCLLAPLLLAACAPLGRQPTVESEVIDPAGAAELYGAAALPDCENRIAYTLLGESEPAAASDAWPGESEMDWDAALRRAMTLCLYAGADTAGDWQLLYYPQALAERSGMRPFYEAYCEQDGLLLDVRFDSTTGALLWWAAEPGAGYWTRALTCGGELEAPGGTPDPALAAAAWPDYAAETAAWGETQGAALADALLQAGGRQTHAAAPAAGGGLPDSWQALYDGWACGTGDPLALCLQFEAEADGQPWQVWRVWVEPTRRLALRAAPDTPDACTQARGGQVRPDAEALTAEELRPQCAELRRKLEALAEELAQTTDAAAREEMQAMKKALQETFDVLTRSAGEPAAQETMPPGGAGWLAGLPGPDEGEAAEQNAAAAE